MAILSLALGIGAAVTMFSAFRAVFLRRCRFEIRSRSWNDKIGAHDPGSGATFADLEFLRNIRTRSRSLGGPVFSRPQPYLAASIRPISSSATSRKSSFALEKAFAGRTLVPSDFATDSPAVAVSYRAWQKDLNFDSHVIGRQMFIDGRSITIAGVMPKEFEGCKPRPGVDAWLPGRDPQGEPLQGWLGSIVGRLSAGRNSRAGAPELRRLLPALAAQYPPNQREIQ